ncbi:MAG: DNA gyrase inhibitor YacG [Candidatus Dasytiphilus stammeri]
MKVECPRCGKKIFWEQKEIFRPFCSKRCKTSDLDHWLLE